jgi:outer membrane receptor for ferrienterochelin and colicin
VLRPLSLFRAVRSLLWLGLVSTTGCGGARAGIEDTNAPSGGKVITADAIAKSGARTAWDAVRFTVPNVQLREVRGEPARIQRRGRASLYQDDQVRVILDHVPIDDLHVLKQVAAADILTIEILTGLDATTHYGATSTSGAIVITTTSGRP